MNSTAYRIAIVAACPYPVPQGSQVLIRDTARLLRDRGHDVQLFTYAHGLGECPAGLNVRRSQAVGGARRTKAGPSLAKPLQDYRLLQALKGALRREPFDCVYAHNYEGLAVALAAGQRPIIYHAHNAMADELPHYFPLDGIPSAFGSWLDRALPKRADMVIASHQRLGDYLADCGCHRDRVHVIPPGIEAFPNTIADPVQGVAPILYMGNLDSYQNLPLLEAAVAHARTIEPDLEWVVATSERVCDLTGATYLHTPDFASLCDVLSRDVVVACPRVSWSGYPIKLLNAMSAGRAVVACRSAAYPIRDGVNGCVVKDNDVAAFGDMLLALTKDSETRTRLGRAARKAAVDEHGPVRIGEALGEAMALAVDAPHAASSVRVISST